MSNKIATAVGKIVTELEEFSADERKRAIAGALAILGDAESIFAPKTCTESGSLPPAALAAQDDWFSGFSPKGIAWIRAHGLSKEQIEAAFHLDNGSVELILGSAIGRSGRERTINTYVLTGAAALLATGAPDCADDVARGNCIRFGCYDKNNHPKFLRDLGNRITGSKKAGWKLTAPGLNAAASLLKPTEGES